MVSSAKQSGLSQASHGPVIIRDAGNERATCHGRLDYNFRPDDLTSSFWRACARLCHQAGGELEQIQFLFGHVSVQTTERYLGCKQRFRNAVNDRIGLEPNILEAQQT